MRKYDRSIPTEYDDLIIQSASNAGVDPEVLRKILWIESNFNKDAQSPTGPKGIAQLTKATAKQLGLNVGGPNDERLDPAKAIPAAARLIKDLDREAKGDVAKLGLLYNQGQGKLGRPQIDAYNKGNYDAISYEGLNYMKLLADWDKPQAKLEIGGITPSSNSNNGALLGTYGKGGITPTANPVEFSDSDAVNYANKGTKDSSLATMNHLAKWYREPTNDYFLYGEQDKDVGFFEGTGQALEASLKNSVVGQAYQAFTQDDYVPLTFMGIPSTYTLTDDDWDKVKTNLKDSNYINVITNNAHSALDIDGLIEQANKNLEQDIKFSETGTGAQLFSGFVGAAADPVSYIPVAGWGMKAAKGSQMAIKAGLMGAQTGALGVVSEQYRTSKAGGEVDYVNTFWGGMAFGAGLSALGSMYKNYKGVDTGTDIVMARAQARQDAIENGLEDMTRINTEGLTFKNEGMGQIYALHPYENGSVVLQDGSVLSPSNILNPETFKKFKEVNEPLQANKGFNWGSLTEIGQIVGESSNEAVRALGNLLMRPPTGYKNGANVNQMTMSDILAHLRATNNIVFEQVEPLVVKAVDTEMSYTQGLTKDMATQRVTRRIAEVMEGSKNSILTPDEESLKVLLQDFFKAKEQAMMNPSMFGNANAKAILRSSKYSEGNYFPVRYDRGQLAHWRNLLGQEGLQDALTKSYMMSLRDPKVKSNIITYLKEKEMIVEGMTEQQIQEVIQKYARNKAYGISHNDNFTVSSKVDEVKDGLVGVENNNYTEARHLFRNDIEVDIQLPDGSTVKFSPNELRSYDLMNIMGNYALRVDGDISIMGATGKTTREIKDEITSLRMKAHANDDAKLRREVEALEQSIIMATGRSRVSPDGLVGEAINSLSNLALLTKGAFIPLMNLTEISGMFAMGNIGGLFRNIPIFKELSNVNKKVSPDTIKDLNKFVFGKELSDAFRSSRQNTIDRLYAHTGNKLGSEIVGSIKWATQEANSRSFWIKWIPDTTNMLIDAAREGFLGDIVGDLAGVAGKSSKWERPELMRAAGITPEQYQGIKDLLRDHLGVDANGKYFLKDMEGLKADMRMYDLWRYGDYISRETILQPHRLDNQSVGQFGAGVRAALMFKNFVIKSLNGRTLSDWYQAKGNGRALEKSLGLFISMGLATLGFMARSQIVASTMDDDKAEAYLAKANAPETLAYNALTRSSVLGGFGIANNLLSAAGWDTARTVRSSLYPVAPERVGYDKGVQGRDVVRELGGNIAEQVPALDIVANVGSAGYNAFKGLTSDNYVDRTNNLAAFHDNLKRIVPNQPLVQSGILSILQSTGLPENKQ